MSDAPYVSVSRVRRFERCPLSYRFRYIDGLPDEPGDALKFGSLLHAVLERFYREVLESEHSGRLDEERLVRIYREEWAEADLSGVKRYVEGLDILQRYLYAHPAVDHRQVLAVEQEFRLDLGEGVEVLGYIDRIDATEDGGVRVVDYKSNRALFTRDEVEYDLQLTVYAMAAQALWPWATEVQLAFYMLRHDVALQTSRTPEQLAKTRDYLVSVARRIAAEREFPARVNADCRYCDYRHHCPAYQAAMQGDALPQDVDLADLDTVAMERERVAGLAKLFYQRRAELDTTIKAAVEEHGELDLAGRSYRLTHSTQRRYPMEPTLRILQEATALDEAELREQLLGIDKAAVDKLLKQLGRSMPRAQHKLLKARLDAVAEKSFSPRLYSKELTPP